LISDIKSEYIGLPTLIPLEFGIMNEIYFAIDNEGYYADLIECNKNNKNQSLFYILAITKVLYKKPINFKLNICHLIIANKNNN